MRLGRLAHALTDYEEVLKLTQGIKAAELFRAFQALTKPATGRFVGVGSLG